MMADSSISRHPRSYSQEGKQTNFRLYYRLIKPGIVYSNVMTGVAGYLLASDWHIRLLVLVALLLGMGLLIAGACVLNNFIDRGLDARMERTKKRASVSGEISPPRILGFGALLLSFGLVALLETNSLTILIGILAVISYVIVYGVAKRRTVYGTLVGTLPGGASLVAGYVAVTDKLSLAAVLLLALMVFWQMAHFFAISIYRIKDYASAGLPLWSIKRGIPSTINQIRLYILAFLFTSFLFTVLGYAGYSFLAVMVVASAYWLNVVYKPSQGNETAWAKKVFLTSLVVLLLMSAMLPISKIVP
ncbi:MAG TPA: heme o synthase [Candidatus Saccharimonadales bacterium]|nr:heme o synthase [Candidatus Saccharimonadales bacterium]